MYFWPASETKLNTPFLSSAMSAPRPASIKRVIFSEDQIQNRILELAKDINEYYKGKQLVVVGILKGAFMFLSDLSKRLTVDHTVEFMSLSSYGDTTASSGNVRIIMDLRRDIVGKHVLVVEDIVDTGNTLKFLLGLLEWRNPASVETCCFLRKLNPEKAAGAPPRWVGFDVEPVFVVGYGLDYAERFRTLPYVGEVQLH